MDVIIVLIAGIVAGFYGTLVGGGGLLTVPVLVLVGLPTQTALGTSKLGGFGTNIGGLSNFAKHKLIDFKLALILTLFLGLGTIIGTTIVVKLSEVLVKKIIAVLIICILLVLIIKKPIGTKKIKKKITVSSWVVSAILMFLVGIYAGFFGGGYGTLMSYILLFFFGQTFLQSAGTRKIPGIVSNMISFLIFFVNGMVNLFYGVVLFIGLFTGSFVGSYYGPRIGNEWLRKGFIVIVLILAVKMFVT
ncbi:MAG: sulfite exporter TauE/SafE family protein [Nanoarchaeota archaeon]